VDAHIIVENCEGKLGYLCMGNGASARISGYGYERPIEMVLIVTDLQAHAVYSIGTFTKQGYRVGFEGDAAAVKNSMGTIIVVGHRENNNVYRVSRTNRDRKFWNSDINTEFSSVENPAHCNMITKNNCNSNTTNHPVNNNIKRVSPDNKESINFMDEHHNVCK